MNSTTAGTLLSLFTPPEEERTDETPAAPVDLRPATARLVATTAPDKHDQEQRPLLLLVVDCPFCGHQHIHPGGHVGEPRLCPRRSRCYGRPPGAYYFPEVRP